MVSAEDGGCNAQLSSLPGSIPLYESTKFKVAISIEKGESCSGWIAENSSLKLSDLQDSMNSELQSARCDISMPCMANRQLSCQDDPDIAIYT